MEVVSNLIVIVILFFVFKWYFGSKKKDAQNLSNSKKIGKDIDDEINEKERKIKDLDKKIQSQLLNLNKIQEKINIEIANKESQEAKSLQKIIAYDEDKLKNLLNAEQKKLLKIKSVYNSIEHSINRYKVEDLKDLKVDVNLSSDIEEALSPTINLKLNYMDIRELKNAFNKNDKLIKNVLSEYKSRYTTKANATIYVLMVIALEAELQNTLFNLKYEKLEKSIEHIKEIISKYEKIAIQGNQNIAPTMSKFIGEIEYLFLEAIKIEYEYYIQKERIKEEQRMLKEQMRQEAAERKILEEQKKKVEDEEAKFLSELEKVNLLIQETEDQEKIKQLTERFSKVQEKLLEVEKNKEEIIKLQNGKAGYVYIISNIGSFGNNVFKIGMTRRLNPQDRVDELGDASVPFRFDVHSFIFSEKAPELESAIHKKMHNKRVNKINLRKEFFACTIEEIESLVYELEPTASFNKTMLAEQYYQSMEVDYIPEKVSIDIEENLYEED